jgi:O-antigen ligase
VKIKRINVHQMLVWLEIVYGALALFALTIGPVYALWRSAQLNNSLLPIEAAHLSTFVVVQLPALFLLGRRINVLQLSKSAEIFLVLLVVWIFTTSGMSDFGAYAFGNAIKVVLCATTGLYLATSFTRLQQMITVALATHVGVLASRFAIARNWPESMYGPGDWSGIYVNPNLLGPVAAVACISLLFVAVPLYKKIPRQWRFAFGAVITDIAIFDLNVLFRTQAFTSIVSTSLVFFIGASAFGAHRLISSDLRKTWWRNAVVILSGGVVVSMIVLYKFSSVVNGNLLPKSVLQERIFAWDFSWTGILERPWLGWGSGVAWSNPIFRRLDLYWTVENIGHSHSAYFDLLLSGGILAGILFSVYLVFALYRMMNLDHPQQTDVARLGLVFFCLTAALFEPFLVTNYFLWPILIMALAPDKERINQR